MIAKRPTRAVFWDIDGTLLVTGRAGMIAWERALAAVTGTTAFPAVRPDGLSDHQIAGWLLEQGRGRPAVESETAALVARYEAELPGALPLRVGRVLDNVVLLLDWLERARPGTVSWLVTGNTLPGATAKLVHYGLADRFRPRPGDPRSALQGSFSERLEPRAHIVTRALDRARSAIAGLEPSEVLVVGDTPHDIEGARAAGAPALALATNVHTLEQLRAHDPWQALPALPGIDAFARLLDQG